MYNGIFLYICNMNRYIAFLLSLFGILSVINVTARTGWKPVEQQHDSLVQLIDMPGDKASKAHIISEMYDVCRRHPDLRALTWRTLYFDALCNPDTAVRAKLLQAAAAMTDSNRYRYDYMRMKLLGKLYITQNCVETYKIIKECHRYFCEINDSLYIGNTYVELGLIFMLLDEPGKAWTAYSAADTIYRNIGRKDYALRNELNLANLYRRMNENEKSVNLLRKIIHDPSIQTDTSFVINVLLSLYECSDSIEECNITSLRAKNLADIYGNNELILKSHINRGAYHLFYGDKDSALYYYRYVLDNYNYTQSNYPTMDECLAGLTQLYDIAGQTDSAYLYQSRLLALRDSVSRANELQKIHRLEMGYEIEKYEMELKNAEQRNRAKRLVTAGILIVALCLSTTVCYILYNQRRKERLAKQLKESENKELATRLENEALQNERFQAEIESQNRELASNALVMNEKKQALHEMSSVVEKQRVDGNISKQAATELQQKIKLHIGQNNEWEYFRICFEKVHPSFFVRMKELFPNISETDLRLCAYIRTGMGNKQIATMLALQPDSIKKSRHRLRKKLGLSIETSIEDFLRSI